MTLPTDVPDYVHRALRASLELGYLESTRNSAGRLLATVAAASTGMIGEFIAGTGAGAAWLVSGAPEGVDVVTVESDPTLWERAQDTLAGSGVEVVLGGWADLAARGPFGLLHLARLDAALFSIDDAFATLVPRGIAVIDEFAPTQDGFAASWEGVDQVRQQWLSDPRFTSVGLTMGDSDVILAVRSG